MNNKFIIKKGINIMTNRVSDINKELKIQRDNFSKGITMKPLLMQYFEAPQENLTVFTCLIDMIALEEGVFGSGTSTNRIARAHRNLQYGLKLKDGSIFRYTHANGPILQQDDTDKIINIRDDDTVPVLGETNKSSN